MSEYDSELKSSRKGGKNGEPTQRFSALQQQLLCAAINFFHRHIRSDQDVLQRMEGNRMFRLFFEVQYHNKPDLNCIFPESVHDCSVLHVSSFILSILHQGIFSVSAFIVSVIYLSRFKEISHITLHACTWRPLFLTSLLLADKVWEDKPVRNSSLAKLFPVLDNAELNKLECEFLLSLKFNVLVKPDLFCSFCEKLLAEQVLQEISQTVACSEYASTLEEGVDPEALMAPKPEGDKQESRPQEAVASSSGCFPAAQTTAAVQAHAPLIVAPAEQPVRTASRPPPQQMLAARQPWLQQAHDGMVVRSLSAGPGLRRTMGGRPAEPPQQLVQTGLAPCSGRGGAQSPCAPPAAFMQQQGRSLSIHPLGSGGEPVAPGTAGASGESVDSHVRAASGQRTPHMAFSGQHMRRSLPATASGSPGHGGTLARAPGSSSLIAPPAPGMGMPSGGNLAGVVPGHGLTTSSAFAGSAPNLGSLPRAMQQSPRSPYPQGVGTPMQAQSQQQHVPRQHTTSQRSPSPMGHASVPARAPSAYAWGDGRATPQQLAASSGQASPSYGWGAAPPNIALPGMQNARSSSASRVGGGASARQAHADTVPVQAPRNIQTGAVRQPGGGYHSPSPLRGAGGYSGAFATGAASVPAPAAHVRHPSPAPYQMSQQQVASGAMPAGIGRSAAGPSPRNPSPAPMGYGAQNAPAPGVPYGAPAAASRGRSPAPAAAAGPARHMVRAPRAGTPSSIISGIAAGTHSASLQQRGSLGGPAMPMKMSGRG